MRFQSLTARRKDSWTVELLINLMVDDFQMKDEMLKILWNIKRSKTDKFMLKIVKLYYICACSEMRQWHSMSTMLTLGHR